MALLDPAHATLRLSRDELAALLLVAADPSSPSLRHTGMAAAAGALAEAGAVVAGRPAPSVAVLAGVVARPQLRLVVEIERGGAVVGNGAWATPDGAVVGRSVGADDVELTLSDPVSLPFAVAALVGLGRRPACPATGPVVTTVADLDEIMASVAGGGAARAARHARCRGHPAAAAVLDLAAHRTHSWRAWSSWMDGRGAVVEAGLTVVDGGQRGLWRCVAGSDGEPGPGTELTLTPATPAEVWQALLGLLPWSGKDPARP
ncbi:MAG: ESX secretion-associated protein EspG [Acidimicrobiales bacterium]